MKKLLCLLLLGFAPLSSLADEFKIDCHRFCEMESIEPNNCNGVFGFSKPDTFRPMQWNSFCNQCSTNGMCTRSISRDSVLEKCGCSKGKPPTKEKIAPEQSLSEKTKLELTVLREKIRSWVLCSSDLNNAPSRANVKECQKIEGPKLAVSDYDYSLGDMLIYSGSVCLSGEMERCLDVKLSQDLETDSSTYGSFWRAPIFVRKSDTGIQFSRDQTLGMLAYLVQTRDTEAAKRWIRFVDRNKKVSRIDKKYFKTPALYNMCPDNGVKPDDRCGITIEFWGLIGHVWKYLGIDNDRDTPKNILRQMTIGKLLRSPIDIVSSHTVPTNGSGYYQSNLLVLSGLIMKKIGIHVDEAKDLGKTLARRSDYDNALYNYLAFGPNEMGARSILKYCPSIQPKFNEPAYENGPRVKGGWLWQGAYQFYHTSFPNGEYIEAWGHDCISVLNHYLE